MYRPRGDRSVAAMRWKDLSLVGVALLGAGLGTGGTFGSGEEVGFDPKTVTVDEGAGNALVTVARDACENPPFHLRWEAPNTATSADRGTAVSGLPTSTTADYTRTTAQGAWGSCSGTGRATTVYTVPIRDDQEVEADETIHMGITVSRIGTGTTPLPSVDPAGTIVIRDDDALRLSTADVTAREDAGVARITVERSGPAGEPLIVDHATANGTAKAGSDYDARVGDVTIPAGERTATVAVPVKADGTRDEGDEAFDVTFNAGEEAATATVTVVDTTPDPKPQEQPTQDAPPTATAAQTPPAAAPRAQAPLPKARCVSRRRFTVRFSGVVRGTVRLGGKKLETTRRNGVLTAEVDLRGKRKAAYTVTVVGETAGGSEVRQTRRYRTCSPKRRR